MKMTAAAEALDRFDPHSESANLNLEMLIF